MKLDAGEDYYICVRAYNNKIGSYTLHAEMNQDKMMKKAYGYNKCTSTVRKDYGSASNYHGVSSKTYFTKTEVIFLYWTLDPACQKKVGIEAKNLYKEFKRSYSSALSWLGRFYSYLPTSYDGIAANVLWEIFDIAFENSKIEPYDMMKLPVEKCGVNCGDKVWTSRSGLLVTETFYSRRIPSYEESFSANNDSVFKGDKGAKGSWS